MAINKNYLYRQLILFVALTTILPLSLLGANEEEYPFWAVRYNPSEEDELLRFNESGQYEVVLSQESFGKVEIWSLDDNRDLVIVLPAYLYIDEPRYDFTPQIFLVENNIPIPLTLNLPADAFIISTEDNGVYHFLQSVRFKLTMLSEAFGILETSDSYHRDFVFRVYLDNGIVEPFLISGQYDWNMHAQFESDAISTEHFVRQYHLSDDGQLVFYALEHDEELMLRRYDFSSGEDILIATFDNQYRVHWFEGRWFLVTFDWSEAFFVAEDASLEYREIHLTDLIPLCQTTPIEVVVGGDCYLYEAPAQASTVFLEASACNECPFYRFFEMDFVNLLTTPIDELNYIPYLKGDVESVYWRSEAPFYDERILIMTGNSYGTLFPSGEFHPLASHYYMSHTTNDFVSDDGRWIAGTLNYGENPFIVRDALSEEIVYEFTSSEPVFFQFLSDGLIIEEGMGQSRKWLYRLSDGAEFDLPSGRYHHLFPDGSLLYQHQNTDELEIRLYDPESGEWTVLIDDARLVGIHNLYF